MPLRSYLRRSVNSPVNGYVALACLLQCVGTRALNEGEWGLGETDLADLVFKGLR